MIYLSVHASARGYFLQHAIRGSHNEGDIVTQVADIADQCGLYPDKVTFGVNIPYSATKKELSEFCLIAQMEGLHISIDDFDSIAKNERGLHYGLDELTIEYINRRKRNK
jgi:hypothetical protein